MSHREQTDRREEMRAVRDKGEKILETEQNSFPSLMNYFNHDKQIIWKINYVLSIALFN